MSDNLRGALAMSISMAAFALEDALLKFAMQTVPTSIVLMLFGVVGLCLFALLSHRTGEPILHPAIVSGPMLIRSACELGGRLFFFLALAFTPLSSTTAILQSAPLVVTLGAVVFLGAHVGPRRWIAMAIGFIGVLMILRPTPASFEVPRFLLCWRPLGFQGAIWPRLSAPKPCRPISWGHSVLSS